PVGASNLYGHNPKDLKYRFQRVAPIHVSPHNPNIVYHGSQYLHKTTDDGLHWETISPDLTAFESDKQVISGVPITRDITGEEFYSTLYSIRESPLREGLIWTGSNDGLIHLTQDGGKTWNNITPSKLPKGGRVDAVEPSKHNPAKAYISVLRYQLGDDKPYIYKTNNYGKSWKLLTTGSNGIPDNFPTRVVREDPVREGLLYAGTEFGLFISFDEGEHWKPFQQNLPVTPVTDIKIHRGDLVLSTMGRSFWILDNITTLRQPKINELLNAPWLFKPDVTIRYRYPHIRNSKSSFPIYPQPGVFVDYYIPKGTNSGVKLDILDKNEKPVVSYISDTTKHKLRDKIVEDMSTNDVFYQVDTSLYVKPGLNRFHWNMKYTGPWTKDKLKRYQNGPMAAPGVYTARLTINDQVLEQQFELIIDPRVKESGISVEDIEVQVAFHQKVGSLVSESQKLQVSLENELKKLKGINKQSERLQKVETALKELKTDSGAYPQPMLTDQIVYLYNLIDSADQLPGNEAVKRFDELNRAFRKLQKTLE
ncbi:MAG: hypothetical protein OEW87_14670, partial [Flavobacteriaceae bacterium]|nr:hypothetical protein [Flavobacteriaceae bacterium]